MDIAPHQFTIVSGMGQGAKLPHYIKCNAFHGLHGRALPVATGLKLANHAMHVLAVAGDGDCYGAGVNHLVHAIRRNINVTMLVHNNQIFGLTRGQASPTSRKKTKSKTQPFGSLAEQLNPLALAISLDCGFVARGFAGASGLPFLKEMIKAAINHKGFALIDILQNCIAFNKVNTYHWYKDRVYQLEQDYDPEDRIKAFSRSLEWGKKIPTGIFYKNDHPSFEEGIAPLEHGPLVEQPFLIEEVQQELAQFY